VWLLLGFSLVLGLLVALFARKVLAAERKARLRFTIVTLLLVLFLFFFGNLIGLVGGLFLLVSMALLFLPSATRYLMSE
jgi:NhaP-type Na+/H+ or K+/H+ antiporter